MVFYRWFRPRVTSRVMAVENSCGISVSTSVVKVGWPPI